METPFFYGQETRESAQYNQNAAALSQFSKTGLTDPEDIIPIVRMLVSDGWWITGTACFKWWIHDSLVGGKKPGE